MCSRIMKAMAACGAQFLEWKIEKFVEDKDAQNKKKSTKVSKLKTKT